jgi:hypothetical protein
MERANINITTVVSPNGVYTITHAMMRYQKQLESSNKWADKKRGDLPKKKNFKPRPNINFQLIETNVSSSSNQG